jgi:hypothetical protein
MANLSNLLAGQSNLVTDQDLAAVATSGSYADLTNKPTLASVATSGSYADLTNKPTIPTVPTLATVATTGSYTDLTNKPVVATLKVSSIAYPGDDLAANPVGGQTITLTGTGFTAGLSVLVNTTMAAVVTVVSSTTVTFTAPAMAAGTYVLYLVATDGSVALSLPGISYSGIPAWSTTAGTLGTQYETTAISKSLSATSTDGAVTYSLVSGTLPPGSTLNTSTGAISGTAPTTNSSTTYNFTIRATDAQNQDTDRAFSITLDPDSVTWSVPSTDITVTADIGTAYSQVLTAISVAGNSISYAANQLPGGVTISESNLTGTLTTEETIVSTITATAANSSRTATRTITFNIVVAGEPFFKDVILLLTGNGAGPISRNYTVTNSGASDYLIDGVGDPGITLIRGSTYTFTVSATGHPFWIKTSQVTGTVSGYTSGITNNGTQSGTITFVVPSDAPSTLYYICQHHGSMTGTINVVDAATSNNTFLDSSINNRTITRNGNIAQGSFSPYGSRWSNHFDGSSTYLSSDTNSVLNFGTSNFTVELWVNLTGTRTEQEFIIDKTSQGFGLALYNGSLYYESWGAINFWAIDFTTYYNSWVHVAVCRSGTTSKMFFNGTEVATNSDTKNYSSSGGFNIGGSSARSRWLEGNISNLRVVKGTALYTSNFTPSTNPLTAITGTSLLTCQSNRFIDNSTNNCSFTIQGSPSVQRFSPFNASATYSTSVIGGSAYFDGSGDYLSTPSTSNLAFGSDDFTIEAWVYANALGSYNAVFAQWPDNGGTANNSYVLESVGSNMNFYWVAGTTLYGPATPGTVEIGVWTHYAICRNGNTLYPFKNGILGTTVSITQTLNSPSSDVTIGGAVAGGGNWNGYIANLRVLKGTAVYTSNFTPPTSPVAAITNTQLLTNFTNSAIFDNAMINSFETAGTAQVSTSVKKYGDGSLLFNGSTDYISSRQKTKFSKTFCIEFWMYRTSTSGNQWIVCNRQGYSITTPANGFLVGYYTGSIAVAGGNLGAYWINGTAPININTWHHVAVCGLGTGCAIYIDGTLTKYEAWPASYAGFTMDGIMVGAGTSGVNEAAGSTHYGGYIDDLRITKGGGRYYSNFTPPAQAFKLK